MTARQTALEIGGLFFFLLLFAICPACAEDQATGAPVPPAAKEGAVSTESQAAKITLVYLAKQYAKSPPLSEAEPIIADKGIQGARLSIKQANRPGTFLGYSFDLVEAVVPQEGDIVAKAKEIPAGGDALIIADLEPQDLLAVADLPEAKNSAIINVRASATVLRQEKCRSNVFHVLPDWAMRADALAQYLVWKKWRRWFVVSGDTPDDKDYVAQIKRAAQRFGGRIVAEQMFALPTEAKAADSLVQVVQKMVPEAIQRAPDHDVLWVVDTSNEFGDLFINRTFLPRAVVGTHGLQPLAWDPSYTEQGGMQLQSQFSRHANLIPVERDYTAWLG